jgi:hypothetical protein
MHLTLQINEDSPMFSVPIAFFLVLSLASDEIAICEHFEVDGKYMKFEILDSHIRNGMNWNEKDPNPQFSVREAIRKSRDVLDQYSRKKLIRNQSWILKEVVLKSTNSETWNYRVVYRTAVDESEVNILLLMDGRWIVPKPQKTIEDK